MSKNVQKNVQFLMQLQYEISEMKMKSNMVI